MPWSTSWTTRARSVVTVPIYVLRVLSDGPRPTWSSHPVEGATVALMPTQSQIQWGSTGPHRWATPVSSATFALMADTDVRGIYQGSTVQLSIILGGESQPVWVGALRQISRGGIGEPVILSCVGMEGALWSRMMDLGAPAAERVFFPETENAYAVATDYTAGYATINLAGSPDLQRRTGGVYCVKVTPNSGADFYLTGSAWAAGAMTIDTRGALDTADADADAGNLVRVVAYDAGHPVSLASRALSARASWPDQWNMALPTEVWDPNEAGAQVAASGLSTAEQETYTWAAEQPMDRIGDVLGPLLSSAGCVICPYQGKITARIIPSPEGIATGGLPLFDRRNIVSASWRAWAVTPQALTFRVWDRTKREPLPITSGDDITTPYGALAYAHALLGLDPPAPPAATGAASTASTTGSDGGKLRGTPVQAEHEVRLPIYGSSANRQAAREDVHQRLKWYSTSRPEALTVTLRGWRPYAVGDVVRIDLPELPARGAGEWGITTGYPAVVVGGGPDFFGATTTLELLCVPANTLT